LTHRFRRILALKATIGVRVAEDAEEGGLHLAEHADAAYTSGRTTSPGTDRRANDARNRDDTSTLDVERTAK
jgi:hypothetical protein